jgi:DNA-binding transcriptional ArsR family regulator
MTEPRDDRAVGTTDEALRAAGTTDEALRAAGTTDEALRAEAATDEALRALAEPRRRAILRLVAHDELAAGEIAAAFDVTRTAVSQHLTVLKNAGLLAERRDGTRRLYRARPEGLEGLRQFLDDLWASSLDVGRRLVEAERGISEGDDAAAAG